MIEAAANTPADPSTQDRMVAAQAEQMEAAAEQELFARQQQARGLSGAGGAGSRADPHAPSLNVAGQIADTRACPCQRSCGVRTATSVNRDFKSAGAICASEARPHRTVTAVRAPDVAPMNVIAA